MGHLDQSEEETGLLAWCFLPRDARWRRRDPWGDRLLLRAGKTFHADDMLEMRRRHLDAWERPLDALRHDPGLVACRVRLTGTIEREGFPRYYIVHGGGSVMTRRGMIRHLPVSYEGVGRIERLYASEFHILWIGDVTLMIHRFACDLVEKALETEGAAGREPDAHAWEMVAARRGWLGGDLTDDEMQDAWTAFDTVFREHQQQRPSSSRGRPMNESETYDLAIWGAHANALRAVRYATEPVSLAWGKSVQNVRAVSYTQIWPSLALGETQEQRITVRAAQTEVINADHERRLTTAGQSGF